MVCGKCSTINDDGDKFCYKCGAPLPASQSAGGTGSDNTGSANPEHTQATAAGEEKFKPTTEDRLAISATTTLAAKKARISDVKSMRPLTQAAYNLVESDRGPLYSTLISLLNVIISLSIVAVVIYIFETINLIVTSTTSSQIAGSLYEQYQKASGDNQQRLLWSILLFIFLVMAFVFCGRLSIRISKVNRKKKRENLSARID